jgi:hypothetical protein
MAWRPPRPLELQNAATPEIGPKRMDRLSENASRTAKSAFRIGKKRRRLERQRRFLLFFCFGIRFASETGLRIRFSGP